MPLTYEQLDILDQVWKQFHKTHCEQSRNLLIEHYRHLVKYAAERVHSKLPSKVELDDLISAGTFGLMDAIEAFDPDRGVKFGTYCPPRIKGSILDELRRLDWAPRLVRTRAHQLAKATQSLEISLGRKPTIKETAEKLNMNMEEFNRLRRDASVANVVSLSTQYFDSEKDDEDLKLEHLLASKADPGYEQIDTKDLFEKLCKGLDRRDTLVLKLYFIQELTMKEIGRTIGLKESRISQMLTNLLPRLRVILENLRLTENRNNRRQAWKNPFKVGTIEYFRSNQQHYRIRDSERDSRKKQYQTS